MVYFIILFQIFSSANLDFLPRAQASLGDDSSTVEADRRVLRGTRVAVVTHAKFAVHEIRSGGMSLKEYAASNGKIFAVTWTGTHQPDLSSIFGTYFEDFSQANQAAVKVKGVRSHARIEGKKVTVERFGHMGSIRGKAFVQSLLPQGVSLDEIK